MMRHWSPLLLLVLVAACAQPPAEPFSPGQPSDTVHAPELRQHTFSAVGEIADPEVSPDGLNLYFASNQDGRTFGLYRKRIGSRLIAQVLRDEEADLRQPRVSPDGRWLAYVTNPKDSWDIHLVDLVDRNSEPIKLAASRDDEFAPAWHPRGSKLMYGRHSTLTGLWQIWEYDSDTKEHTKIGESSEGLFPSPSPDTGDARIVFHRFRGREPAWAALWLMNTDGTDLTQLLGHAEWAAITPVWDNTGQWVVFAAVGKAHASRAGLASTADDLWMIRKDGTQLTRLTGDGASDWGPCVATHHGEERVFFVSDRSGHPNVWSVRLPGEDIPLRGAASR